MVSDFEESIMKVPLLDLKAHHEPIRKDLLAAIEQVLDKNNFILGDEVRQLEEAVASYCHTRYGIGVSSGTDALQVSLMALNIGAGDEVITSPLTFFATAGAIVRVGARPIFVDIDAETYNLDPTLIEAAITPRTRAIIPVHLYGQCADMEPILEIGSRHGIAVIEDAAQAIGAEYRDGRRAGGMGVAGCLSFFPSKNLGGLGDGGMVVTNDEGIAERIRMLRVQGAKPKYYHSLVGGNFRLDTLQAAVLNVKLGYLDRWTSLRQKHATLYEDLFSRNGLAKNIGLRLPRTVYRGAVQHYHTYNQFMIGVPNRDGLREYLQTKGIGTEVYYPVALHRQECLRFLGYGDGAFPLAEQACNNLLALPIHPELTEEQQTFVVQSVQGFYR
jgi:dTDP-4-amino-4,6-dideoxygalactose transaminase